MHFPCQSDNQLAMTFPEVFLASKRSAQDMSGPELGMQNGAMTLCDCHRQ
jgi:hypothetical protein